MEEDHDHKDPDMMDWTPTDPSGSSSSQNASRSKHANDDGDGLLLRRQRFFPPEQPTGLEGLFARTLFVDENSQSHVQQDRTSHQRLRPRGLWGSALLLVLLLAVAYMFWRRWDVTITWTRSGILTPRVIDYEEAI